MKNSISLFVFIFAMTSQAFAYQTPIRNWTVIRAVVSQGITANGYVSGLQEDFNSARVYSATANTPGIYLNVSGGAAAYPFAATQDTANALCKTLVGPNSTGAIGGTKEFENVRHEGGAMVVFAHNNFVVVPGVGHIYMTKWACAK